MSSKIENRIIEAITNNSGCISQGMLACDLRLADSTIARHVKNLIKGGRVEIGWDGNALQITDQEQDEQDFNKKADRILDY